MTKNKFFEFEADFGGDMYHLFSFDLDTSFTGDDHAGPRFEIEFLTARLSIKLYDHRHWDYANDAWEVYGRELPPNKE